MSILPTGWVETTLSSVASDSGYGTSQRCGYDETGLGVLRIPNIKRGSVDLSDLKRAPSSAEIAGQLCLRAGDLLLVRTNGSRDLVGRCAPVTRDIDASFASYLIRFRILEEVADVRYLSLMLGSPVWRRRLEAEAASSAGQFNLSLGKLAPMPVALPPLSEQRRIVGAIEEALSKLDAGDAGLRAVRQRLRRMRESVLAEMFGALEFTSPLDTLCDAIVDCPHSTAKFVVDGRPCVDTTCIEPGRVVMDRLRYVSEETWVKRVRRLVPQEGDIVFAREGTIGTAVSLPSGLDPCLGQRVMLMRPSGALMSRFLEKALMSRPVRDQYRPLVAGSTAPHLNVRDVKALRLPLPPVAEQHRIVAEIDRQFSFIEAAERAVDAGLARSAALRRSVLKAAFEGRLVPQDPSDEPASFLLDRIRAERTANPTPKMRRARATA